MSLFTLDLDLRHHCIATEVKKRYNKALSEALKSRPGHETPEDAVELLKEALETLDFPELRARYPELSGHFETPVTLGRDGSRLFLCIGENPVKLLYRKD